MYGCRVSEQPRAAICPPKVGGIAMLALVIGLPFAAYMLTGGDGASLAGKIFYVLSLAPGAIVIALLAPLAGERRRLCFAMILPLPFLKRLYKFGETIAALSNDRATAATASTAMDEALI
jgi:hypothetical protein